MKIKINTEKILSELKGKKLGVLCGGLSEEREVSLKSGKNVYNALKKFPLDVQLIDVGRNVGAELVDKQIDIVYNTLHGTYGEDGIIQGVLELLCIGYTGENVLTSATCMHKLRTKTIWEHNGLNTPSFAMLNNIEFVTKEKIILPNQTFSFPVVVKPIVSGSSVGVHVVKDAEQLRELMTNAEDTRCPLCMRKENLFIEQYIPGKEVTVGILTTEDGIYVLPILGINPKPEFYSYEAKYTENMTDFEMPAKIDRETELRVIDICKKAYQSLDCKGLCRIDILIEKDSNIPYAIEINTQTGLTDTSDVPQMVREDGMDVSEFILYILSQHIKAIKDM